jgi:hypothetical protein
MRPESRFGRVSVDIDKLTLDCCGFLVGGAEKRVCSFEDLSSHTHPADRDRVRAAFAATRAIFGSYEIDFRILVGDEVRWMSARGQGDDPGMVHNKMFGIFLYVANASMLRKPTKFLPAR